MGTRWNRLAEAVLTSTHNLCFEQKYIKITEFLYEIFHFFEVKFSIYLNRCVFVMLTVYIQILYGPRLQECADSEGIDHHAHSRSMIRAFSVCCKNRWLLQNVSSMSLC